MTRAPKKVPAPPAGCTIGYCRVSTTGQTVAAQVAGLKAAGCTIIFEVTGSGADRDRPELAKCLASIRPGDVLIIPALDRIARGLTHLLEVVDVIKRAGGHFRSIREAAIDTSSISGMLLVQIIGAIAHFERELIKERTKLGIRAAMARGKKMGSPGLRAKDKGALQVMTDARVKAHTARLVAASGDWLPIVASMRPLSTWEDTLAVVNQRIPGAPWSEERLRRGARRCVEQGLLDRSVLDRAERKPPDSRLMMLLAGIAMANPSLSYRDIARQMQAMKERSPRGGAQWSPSSVHNMLARAVAAGLLAPFDIEAGERRAAA
jgi:DNA invertase Pin-like site-specific DNA recombinase